MICFIFVLWSWAAADCTGKSYLVSLFPLVLKWGRTTERQGVWSVVRVQLMKCIVIVGKTRSRNQEVLVLVVQVHPCAIWGQSIPSPYLNFLLLKMRQLDVRAFSSFNIYAQSSVYIYFLTQNPI